MRKVTRVLALRQVEVEFKNLQKGDIFSMEIDDNGKKEVTDWALALESAQEDPNAPSEIFVPSDKVYFIVGKPEISKIVMNNSHAKKESNIQAARVLQ